MNTSERLDFALEFYRLARKNMIAAAESPDPVMERRELVEAAKKLRKAADYLDDEGRLQ